MKKYFCLNLGSIALILLGNLAVVNVRADINERKIIVQASADADSNELAPEAGQKHVIIRSLKSDGGEAPGKELTWLGVGVEEASEPLTAQLDLKPGEGLVVNFVSPDSPALAAGLQKNDVLAELDGQMLVAPDQLRKLVQMRTNGDSVKIIFYHAGKKQTVSVKLASKKFSEAFLGDDSGAGGAGRMRFQFAGFPQAEKGNLNADIQRTMEEARKAVQDAMRESSAGLDGQHRLEIIHKKLGGLATGGVSLGKDATVTVKSESESVRTIVKNDESGSYVIVADPTKHLTAHDAHGKLVFDGLIETSEQQQKVPKEVWKKVEPLLEQLKATPLSSGKPEAEKELPEK